MKLSAKLILAIIVALNLTACVLTINNFGDNNHINKKVDDIVIEQDYEVTGNRRK